MIPINTPTLCLTDEYAHITAMQGIQQPGEVQLATFAEVCAAHITAHIDVKKQPNQTDEASLDILTSYIYHTVHESNLGMFATVGAMALIERFQDKAAKINAKTYDMAGLCRLFMAAYVTAVKIMHDEQPKMEYWMQVTDGEYGDGELIILENQLCRALGWKTTISSARYEAIHSETMEAYHDLRGERDAVWAVLVERGQREELGQSDSWSDIELEEIPILDKEDEELFEKLARSSESLSPPSFQEAGRPLAFFRRKWHSFKQL